eukprot:TRINITY_DN33807_c0_g1_i2.p1 TRINITY_DN33807_c0_g1~~TRINITY_DN33807_c0_g1_i2.p1  ORF type:complete len:824 (+),score=182.64 TRINITY_DN33807_c0_g1_i2:93-2564(+)
MRWSNSWIALVALLVKAYPGCGQLDLQTLHRAEHCLTAGLVLDLHALKGAGLRCVPRGSCPNGAVEAFGCCASPQGSAWRDVALTLQILCSSCDEDQVGIARAAWLAVALALQIPMQEMRAAMLRVPGDLSRNRFPHWILREQQEAPLLRGSRQMSSRTAAPVHNFVTLRIKTARLLDKHGPQALLGDASDFFQQLVGLTSGLQLRVVELAEQEPSFEVVPGFVLEGFTQIAWANASDLQGSGYDQHVAIIPIEWPGSSGRRQQADQAVILVPAADRPREDQSKNEGDQVEDAEGSAAWFTTLVAVGTLLTVFAGVGCTAYVLQASRRKLTTLERLTQAEVSKQEPDDLRIEEMDEALPPAPALPGSIHLPRPASSRSARPASRNQRSRPPSRQDARPTSRQESRPYTAGGAGASEQKRRKDVDFEASDKLGWAENRPFTSPGRMRLPSSKVKIQPELILGPADFETLHWEDPREFLRGGDPLVFEADKLVLEEAKLDSEEDWFPRYPTVARPRTPINKTRGTNPPPIRRVREAPPMQEMWASGFRELHHHSWSDHWSSPSTIPASTSQASSRARKEPAADAKVTPKGKAKQHQPEQSEQPEPTQAPRPATQEQDQRRVWFAWSASRPTSRQEPPKPTSQPTGAGGIGEESRPESRSSWFRPSSSSGVRPSTAASARSGNTTKSSERLTTSGFWRSETGEFLRPATLKGRVRPETPTPQPAPATRLQRAARAAKWVIGRSPEEREQRKEESLEEPQDPAARAELLVEEMMGHLEQSREEPLHVRKLIFRDLQRQLHPDKNTECEEAAKHAFQKLMEQRTGYLR